MELGLHQRLSFAQEAQRKRRAERRYCQDLSTGKEQTQPESQAVWLLVQQAHDFGGDFGVSGCWPCLASTESFTKALSSTRVSDWGTCEE